MNRLGSDNKRLLSRYESTCLTIDLNALLLGFGTRLRMQQLQQKDWIEQQKREKELLKEQERFRNAAFDAQTKHFNNLLEDAQTKHAAARVEMERSVKDANAQLAKEKRDKEAAQRAYEQL